LNRPARKLEAVTYAARFSDLWLRGLLPDASTSIDAEALYGRIVQAYGSPDRRYHTLDHIEHCIRQLELAQRRLGASAGLEADGVEGVEFGIWYHDIVYVPEADDNEAQSAELFSKIATGALSADMIDRVHRIIMATLHLAKPERPDEQLMVDIDLSSFGMEWDHFRRDSIAVRTEMGHQSEAEFSLAQGQFLNNLLSRDSVYCTELFQDLYEARARENIGRYIGDFLT